MLIEGYGIKLIRLTEKDIELVRMWRNSKHINRFMEFREEISPNQQLEWFNSINNINNNYFVIEEAGEKIGLINGAQIDWEKCETMSGGIFIWDDNYWKSKIPIASSLLLTDTSVLLGLRRTYAKILSDNKNAITFNKMLGYELLPNQEGRFAQDYVLETTNYLIQRDKLRKMLFPQIKDFKLKITFQNCAHPLEQFYIEKLTSIGSELQKELELTLEK